MITPLEYTAAMDTISHLYACLACSTRPNRKSEKDDLDVLSDLRRDHARIASSCEEDTRSCRDTSSVGSDLPLRVGALKEEKGLPDESDMG